MFGSSAEQKKILAEAVPRLYIKMAASLTSQYEFDAVEELLKRVLNWQLIPSVKKTMIIDDTFINKELSQNTRLFNDLNFFKAVCKIKFRSAKFSGSATKLQTVSYRN